MQAQIPPDMGQFSSAGPSRTASGAAFASEELLNRSLEDMLDGLEVSSTKVLLVLCCSWVPSAPRATGCRASRCYSWTACMRHLAESSLLQVSGSLGSDHPLAEYAGKAPGSAGSAESAPPDLSTSVGTDSDLRV